MALTAKQERFVEEYLVDLNATQAAIRAGYSKSTAHVIGCENLSKPNISDAIAKERAKVSARVGVTQEMIAEELRKIGFQDIRKAVKWGSTLEFNSEDGEQYIENGVALVNSDEIDDDTAAAISEVSQTKEGIKIKMHDKKGALVDLGKHLGMFEKEDAKTGEIHIHFGDELKQVL